MGGHAHFLATAHPQGESGGGNRPEEANPADLKTSPSPPLPPPTTTITTSSATSSSSSTSPPPTSPPPPPLAPPPPPPVGDDNSDNSQQQQHQSQCRDHKTNVKDEIPRCQCFPPDQCKSPVPLIR